MLNEEKIKNQEKYKNSIFWDLKRFPTKKDGSPLYINIRGFYHKDSKPTYLKDGVERVGHGICVRYFPANEFGLNAINELILSKEFEALYMCQSLFYNYKKTQRLRDVGCVTHSYVDLDIYKCKETNPSFYEEWKYSSDDGKVALLLGECLYCGLPQPTEIIFSGGGAYMMWRYTDPVFISRKHGQKVESTFLAIHSKINRAICEKLKTIESDPSQCHSNAILRITGSINFKHSLHGNECRTIYTNKNNVYKSDDFRQAILGPDKFTKDDKIARKKSYIARGKELKKIAKKYKEQGEIWAKEKLLKQSIQNNVVPMGLGRAKNSPFKHSQRVINDLRTLATLRWNGFVGDGYHDLFGHLAVSACSGHFKDKPDELLAYTRSQIEDFMDKGYLDNCFEAHNATSVKMLKENSTDETSGSMDKSRYNYSIERMIYLLKITQNEMKSLKCLVSKEIKRDIHNKQKRELIISKRKAKGAIPRKKYEENSLSKTKPWEDMGISKSTYYRNVKKGENTVDFSKIIAI